MFFHQQPWKIIHGKWNKSNSTSLRHALKTSNNLHALKTPNTLHIPRPKSIIFDPEFVPEWYWQSIHTIHLRNKKPSLYLSALPFVSPVRPSPRLFFGAGSLTVGKSNINVAGSVFPSARPNLPKKRNVQVRKGTKQGEDTVDGKNHGKPVVALREAASKNCCCLGLMVGVGLMI